MGKKFDFTRYNRQKKTVENVGRLEIRNEATTGAELYIYGDIVSSEGWAWGFDDVFPQKVSDFLAEIDNAAPLTVYVNSGGGDVFAGIAIYNLLKRHEGHTKAVVDALAASIASVIVMGCDEVEVSTGAQIMIHKPWMRGTGNADDLRKYADELDGVENQMVEIYMSRAKEGVTEEAVRQMLTAETWLTGAEAAEVFDLAANEAPPVAACAGALLLSYAKKPAALETADYNVFKGGDAEAAAILENIYLYGT